MLALQAENQAIKSKENEEKPTVQWGCYKFTGDDRLYCPACYDTKGKRHLDRPNRPIGLQSKH